MLLIQGYTKESLKIMWKQFYKKIYPNKTPKIKEYGFGYALYI